MEHDMRSHLSVVGAALTAGALATAGSAWAAQESAQSKACWAKADSGKLHGEERTAFHARCMAGPLAPKVPSPRARTEGARAIVAPSGADKTVRSGQCQDEANKRGLKDADYQAFRLACLASAAPAQATGSKTQPAKPTRDKPGLDNLTNGQAR
jgi:hypothetical protein